MDKKIHLIFAWRLTIEKWFDMVLWLCDDILKSKREDKVCLHIFGQWDLEKNISNYEFLIYHWQQPKEKVFEVWKTCDYSLMPSRFLETFGLSALDSLSLWVPVIGYKKWGLLQFDDGIIDLGWSSLFDAIKELDSVIQTKYDTLSKKCKKIASKYIRENWKNMFEQYLWRPIAWSKILLLSDFSNNMWGIETYIESISQKLQQYWASHISRIWTIWSKKWWLRYIKLALSVYNIPLLSQIKKHIKQYNNYDLIWRHSTQRALWPIPIRWIGKNTSSKQWVMMHDFGLYHPFPSQIYSEEEIIDSKKFWKRMEAGFERLWSSIPKKILRFLPLFFKYISSWRIKNELEKNMDVFLTPSKYINPHLQEQYNKNILIHTLPHMI